MVHRLLTVVASVVAEQRPWSGQAPEVVVGRLSCPVACGIFFLTRDWAHVPCIGRQILTYQGSPKCFCIASIQKPECGTQFFANKALERWSTCSNAIWEAEEGREPPHLRQMQAGSPFPNQKEIKGCVGCRRSPQKLRPTLLENYLIPRNWKEYSLLHFKDVFPWQPDRRSTSNLKKLCHHYHLYVQRSHFSKQRAATPIKGNIQIQTHWHVYYKSVSAGFYLKSKLFQQIILWSYLSKVKNLKKRIWGEREMGVLVTTTALLTFCPWCYTSFALFRHSPILTIFKAWFFFLSFFGCAVHRAGS